MTASQDGHTGEQPQVTPTVTTAPARSRWSKIPAHLGRARTSTVIMSLLFLGIGALYLEIRPTTTGTATAETSDQQPATTTTPVAPTTTAPTTEAPETTSEAPETTTEDFPTTTPSEPTETTTPGEPTDTTVPTETLPSDPGTEPTTVSPPG
jgi:cytoskeletal protein RodZ